MDTNALSDFTQEELIDIKQRVESWPDYKKQNYTAIFGKKNRVSPFAGTLCDTLLATPHVE